MFGTVLSKRKPDGIQVAVLADETGYGLRRTTKIRFTEAVFDLADNAGVGGYITFKVYDFPEGLIAYEGGSLSIRLTKKAVSGDGAGLSDTFDGDVGVGTTIGIAATLATTEQDFIPTTSIPQAVAGVATATAVSAVISGATGAPRTIDGSGTAVDMYLTILVDDADQDATGHPVQVQFDGELTFNWSLVGDI